MLRTRVLSVKCVACQREPSASWFDSPVRAPTKMSTEQHVLRQEYPSLFNLVSMLFSGLFCIFCIRFCPHFSAKFVFSFVFYTNFNEYLVSFSASPLLSAPCHATNPSLRGKFCVFVSAVSMGVVVVAKKITWHRNSFHSYTTVFCYKNHDRV